MTRLVDRACGRYSGAALVAAIWLVGLAPLSPAYAGAVAITECGQFLQGGKGILMNDLDCPVLGVQLQSGRLDLNGFTITAVNTGVSCEPSCKIIGPGTITGASTGAVASQLSSEANGIARMRISDGVVLTGNVVGVIVGGRNFQGDPIGTLTLKDSEVSGNSDSGVVTNRRIKMIRSVVSGNGGDGVGGRDEGLDFNLAESVTAKDSEISGNAGWGVRAIERGKLVRTVVQNNGIHGAFGEFRLSKVTLAGNGTDPSCGVTQTCADVASGTDPKIDNVTTCETSYDSTSGFPGTDWAICSLD